MGEVAAKESGRLMIIAGGNWRHKAAVRISGTEPRMIVGVRSGVTHAIGSATEDDGVSACDNPGFVAVFACAEEILRVFEGAWLICAMTAIGRVCPAIALLAISPVGADKPGVPGMRRDRDG